jgi:hypothetical protein
LSEHTQDIYPVSEVHKEARSHVSDEGSEGEADLYNLRMCLASLNVIKCSCRYLKLNHCFAKI